MKKKSTSKKSKNERIQNFQWASIIGNQVVGVLKNGTWVLIDIPQTY